MPDDFELEIEVNAQPAIDALRRLGYAAWYRPGVMYKDKDGRYRTMSVRVLRLMEYVYPDLESAHADMERWYVQGTIVQAGMTMRSTVILNPTPYEEPIIVEENNEPKQS